jgi:PPM family protein phosphatase
MTNISDFFKTNLATATMHSENQDRAQIIESPHGLVLIIADGAGGIKGGGQAAEFVIQSIKEQFVSSEAFSNPLTWYNMLSEADHQLYVHPLTGETTAVIMAITEDFVCGASVGDSSAFLLENENDIELTAKQWKKPLLGSGIAVPTAYGPLPLTGILLLATDGLTKYAQRANIHQIVLNNNIEQASHQLIESVRYPSGDLPDDVTVILCEKIDKTHCMCL